MIEKLKTSMGTASVYADIPNECPICKTSIVPVELYAKSYVSNESVMLLAVLFMCPACYDSFICQYGGYNKKTSNSFEYCKRLYCEPNRFKGKQFDEKIANISESFIKIYNQALAAETTGLYEIAGMGYRKALEFLIKDYLIAENPDDKETIGKMDLGNCIANKIPDDNLKAVASRCAWIGNDESHYYRKHIDLGVDDLKDFLDAVIYWIMSCVATKTAMNIGKK